MIMIEFESESVKLMLLELMENWAININNTNAIYEG